MPASSQLPPSLVVPPFAAGALDPAASRQVCLLLRSSCSRIHQSVFHPAGAANSRDPSLGICLLLLNTVDFTGEAFGDSGDV